MATDRIDPGDALDVVLSIDRRGHRLFDPDDFVEAVLRFANERDEKFLLQLYLSLGNSFPFQFPARDNERTLYKFDTREQQWVQKQLTRMFEGTDDQRLELARELADEADQMALFPQTIVAPGKSGPTIETRFAWESPSVSSVLSRGLITMLDTRRDYMRRLCHCKLPECGRWFLAETRPGRAGAPNTAYCTPHHAKSAERERKRREAIDRRKRIKEAAKQPRPRRRK